MKIILITFVLFSGLVFAQKTASIADVLNFPKDYLGKNLVFSNIYFRPNHAIGGGDKYFRLYLKESHAGSEIIVPNCDAVTTKNIFKQLIKADINDNYSYSADIYGKIIRDSGTYLLLITKINTGGGVFK
jgi:hypothetical protein